MTIDMDLVNLTLGIVGTIAGVVSLTVHLWRLKRENPRLTINVLSCEHYFENETKVLSFWSETELRNLGDRGTDMLGIDLKFEYKEKDYNLKMSNQEPLVENGSIRWIRPHQTIRTFQTAFIKFEGPPKEQLDCIFTLYHTHGAEKVKAKSQKRKTTYE
ncbi:MAG: hypothetical protein NWF06_11565 [Candidatus Bathyarchaeota archaeon]|nr:hypothetical protein [Candidatus Bathyarchaeum sp.]